MRFGLLFIRLYYVPLGPLQISDALSALNYDHRVSIAGPKTLSIKEMLAYKKEILAY